MSLKNCRMPQNEGGWSNFFYSKWFILVALLAIGIVGFAFIKAYYQDYQVREAIEQLKYEASQLETKRLQSIEVLKYVQSSDFVESKARSDFNMVKPGEQVAVIVGTGTSESDYGQPQNKVIDYEQVLNPIKWWRFFFNK